MKHIKRILLSAFDKFKNSKGDRDFKLINSIALISDALRHHIEYADDQGAKTRLRDASELLETLVKRRR